VSHIDQVVQRVKAAYAVLEPQGKVDAYDGMESARITAEMLLEPDALTMPEGLFIQLVYEKANLLMHY